METQALAENCNWLTRTTTSSLFAKSKNKNNFSAVEVGKQNSASLGSLFSCLSKYGRIIHPRIEAKC